MFLKNRLISFRKNFAKFTATKINYGHVKPDAITSIDVGVTYQPKFVGT